MKWITVSRKMGTQGPPSPRKWPANSVSVLRYRGHRPRGPGAGRSGQCPRDRRKRAIRFPADLFSTTYRLPRTTRLSAVRAGQTGRCGLPWQGESRAPPEFPVRPARLGHGVPESRIRTLLNQGGSRKRRCARSSEATTSAAPSSSSPSALTGRTRALRPRPEHG